MAKDNIYQKLLEVRKAVPKLTKNNKGYQYDYVSSSQTLEALRAAMDEQGLILVPQVLEHTAEKHDKQYFTELAMQFVWVNVDKPEERIECKWYGQGLDTGEKGVGKALTYAEKYFLLKFFNIATDSDDPDAHQGKAEPQEVKEKPQEKSSTKNIKGVATDKMVNYLEGLSVSKVIDDYDEYVEYQEMVANHKKARKSEGKDGEYIPFETASKLIDKLQKYSDKKGKE